MADRLIPVPHPDVLNAYHSHRHWFNAVRKDQNHLFEAGGLFGPLVEPILYDACSTRWILKYKDIFISIRETDGQPEQILSYKEENNPQTVADVVYGAKKAIGSNKFKKIHPSLYGGREANREDLRKWWPWNLKSREKYLRWIRYPLKKQDLDELNYIDNPYIAWTDDFTSGTPMGNEFIEFCPVVMVSYEDTGTLPSHGMLAFHVYEKAFYFYRERVDYNMIAKLLDRQSGQPINYDRAIDWVKSGGWGEYELDSDKSDVYVCEDVELLEGSRPEWRFKIPWDVNVHGEPTEVPDDE